MITHSSILAWNSMDRGAWQATVHGVAESQTWLRDQYFDFHEDVTHHKLNSSAAFFWNLWLVSRLTLDSLCDIHFYSAFPIFAGKSHGWRFLVGPQGHRESDTIECVHTHPKWKSVFSKGTGNFFFFKVKSYLVGIFRTLSLGDSISVALRILPQGSRRWLQAIYKFAAKRAGSLNIKDQILGWGIKHSIYGKM